MAKKKIIRKGLTEEEREEILAEGELPKKSVVENETRQLIGFFVVVALVFTAFLIPYFYIQGVKSFDYVGVSWFVEDVPAPINEVYHGVFPALNGENYEYNLFLRNDPRTNDVSVSGDFQDFKIGGYISLSPEIDSCRRGVGGYGMITLSEFLRLGLGIQQVLPATSDFDVHNSSGREYVDCNTKARTVVMVEIGEPSVVQSETNPFCYTIRVKDCNDVAPMEKFMIEVIEANS